MRDSLKSFGRLASPRGLLGLSLVLGSLTGIAGHGTLAFYSSTVVGQSNAFSGGVVDLANTLTSSGGASLLPQTAFSWTTGGAHTAAGSNPDTNQDCANILTGLDVRTQAMAPGHYCVARVDILNGNANSVDGWLRMRLVRTTPTGWNADAQVDAATEALNDRLRIYMHEYTGGASAATNKTERDTDCTTGNYKPTWTGPTATGAAGTAAQFTSVPGTSSGQILSKALSNGVSRTALTSLGDAGKNVGAHPGLSAVSVTAVAGARGAYGADQDQAVLNLVNKSDEATTDATTGTGTSGLNKTSNNGLRVRAGTDTTANGGTHGPAPTEANMKTALATRNAFNLIGNDEVTNPVKMGATAGTALTPGTNNSFDPSTTSNANLGPRNGTEPHGTNLEAEIKKGAQRYFCAAIFLPSDTDANFPTVYSTDGANENFGSAYDATAGQYVNCTDQTALPGAGCANLGTGAQALTAANARGDNSAALGQVTYYMVVTAAQKAGRTTNQ
jgi:hypothetical protein